jgi:beta-1,4-mannosyl-glycoprotein beta-1,4-N-acetylglucosaminyltransferase
MISEKKNIIGGKIKEKDYIISFYAILNILTKKKIFKYIILIFVVFIIYLLFYKNNKDFNGRIFVTFMYNNEAETAYIHIWRLYNYIDKFIIVISNITHSNLSKNISFRPFEENIQPYIKKIDIINFNNICNRKEYPSDSRVWCLEKSQRDYAKTFIEENYNPTENDLIIIVDLDEILTREGIKYIKKNPPENYYFIKGSLYFPYYYHKVQDWDIGCVIRYKKNMTTFNKYRKMPIENHILKYKINPSKPLITHCSYCFKELEQYKNKIKSFSHQEYNKPP